MKREGPVTQNSPYQDRSSVLFARQHIPGSYKHRQEVFFFFLMFYLNF